jgi:2-polyprenyl-3-methyl-5-hydroxy-6-metoxy-1,4-benzoquinol methylase
METSVANKEFVKCLCGTTGNHPYLRKLPGVVQCDACGLVYANPRFKKKALEDFYSKEYFESNASGLMGYDNYLSDEHLVNKTFARRLEEIERKWVPEKGKILDVGCATGFFLRVARERGWKTEGVELSRFCCDYAASKLDLQLHQGFFTEIEGLTSDYGLITMWDYIEHSLQPLGDIERAHALLKPGGVLALATPDVGSVPAKIFKERWMGFKEHEHLYYFTKENLKGLLEKTGFQVVEARYTGKFISLSFFTKRLIPYSKVLGYVLQQIQKLPGFKKLEFYCNPFDIVYLIAKKHK